MQWIRRHMPDLEKHLSRARSYDWLLGAWGLAGLVNLLVSVVTAVGTFIYAQAWTLIR